MFTRHPFFVVCARNLEPMLLTELKELGVEDARAVHLGVEAQLNREEVYRIVYASRLASRVLRPLAVFDCPDEEALYGNAREFNWDAIIRPGKTFKITASVADSGITHSQYAALKFKDAVADSIRAARGERPDVDKDDPDVRLHLHLHRDRATISLSYSTGVMHRRGYRPNAVEAPLKENLAATMLRLAKWDGTGPLRDFFCGSGTILLEAAMLATRTPAGWFRPQQGFEELPDFDEETWSKVKAELDAGIVPLRPGLIAGADIEAKSVVAARSNIRGTPYANAIPVGLGDFRTLEGDFSGAVVVTNPPYGVRLGSDGDASDASMHKLYQDFGYFMKTRCPGGRVCMLFPDESYEKDIWFKPERGMFLDNGAISVRANVYEVR